MPNTYLTIDRITKESAMVLYNMMPFASSVDREYDPQYHGGGGKNGSTLRLRKPPRFTTNSGATLVNQDYVDESVTLTTATQQHVAITIPIVDMTMSIEEMSERWIKPALAPLAAKVDGDGLALYKDIYNAVGTPGTPPSTVSVLTDSQAKLDQFSAPRDFSRCFVVEPIANGKLIEGMKGLFHANMAIEDQFRSGLFAKNIYGFREISMDQNVKSHTNGLGTGTPIVQGASQTGASLVTDGWTASQSPILKRGDIFTITSGANVVNSVNPVNYESNGVRQQFVVTADVNSDGSGVATIPISPSILTSAAGARQTVTASPSDNAAITLLGASLGIYPQNLAYHKDAMVLGTADLEKPDGGAESSRQVYKGISVQWVKQFDIATYVNRYRVDVLYGWVVRRPEHVVRVFG